MDLSMMANILGPMAMVLMHEDQSIPNPHVFRKNYRVGGMVGATGIEAEGGEVVQEPQGEAYELEGPQHEQGGIDMPPLPEGTVIYSDKVKGPDGKTMAERKARRDKLIEQLSKNLKGSKADAIHRATMERAMEATVLEDMMDIATMTQEFMKAQQGSKVKARTGYVVPPLEETQLTDIDLTNAYFEPTIGEPKARTLTVDKLNPSLIQDPFADYGVDMEMTPSMRGGDGTMAEGMPNTAGDVAAIAGPLGKTLTTIFNRLGDRPQPNFNQNYGQEALELNAQGMRGMAAGRDQDIQRNNRMLNALRNYSSVRSINTSRAMDLGALTQGGDTANRISARFQQQMQQALAQRAGMVNDRDRVTAAGAERAHVANVQDRDAFYTSIGQNIGDITAGVQSRERNQLRRQLGNEYQEGGMEDMLMNFYNNLLYRQ